MLGSTDEGDDVGAALARVPLPASCRSDGERLFGLWPVEDVWEAEDD